MIQVDVTAFGRNEFGKGAARGMRRMGFAPAILYGAQIEPVPLKINIKEVTKTLVDLQRQHAVINLKIDEDNVKDRYVMLKEVQVDPVHDTLKHLDFYAISLDKPVTLKVPLKFVGKAVGLELGGDMIVGLGEVSLQGLPLDIPSFLEVDVTELNINDKLTCAALVVPENITLLEDEDRVCVSIFAGIVVEPEETEEEVTPVEDAEEQAVE